LFVCFFCIYRCHSLLNIQWTRRKLGSKLMWVWTGTEIQSSVLCWSGCSSVCFNAVCLLNVDSYPDCSWCAGRGGCCPLFIEDRKLEKKNCISSYWPTGMDSHSDAIIHTMLNVFLIMSLSISDNYEVSGVLCWWSSKCFLHHHCWNRPLLAHIL